MYHSNLASLFSVRGFASNVKGQLGERGLALLVNNAAVGFGGADAFSATADGLEEIVGVNHIGHFALTRLLTPDLRRYAAGNSGGRAARVVVVSSSLHDSGTRMGGEAADCLLPEFPDGVFAQAAPANLRNAS